jgi:hypothetical protein
MQDRDFDAQDRIDSQPSCHNRRKLWQKSELDLTKLAAIEEHLRTCVGCPSQYELRVALRSRLADPDLRYVAPKDLASRKYL